MLICTALTCIVIGNAYYQRKQFYPTVVHITKSNPSMAVSFLFLFFLYKAIIFLHKFLILRSYTVKDLF